MREHNELTKKLLAEGYTAENYPDYVILPGSCWGNDKLQNLSRGFEYKREVSDKFVYKTGCGMYLLGENAITNMSFMGYSWMHENYIVVANCPYRKTDCELNNPVLNHHKFKHCECRRVNEEYSYDNSVEKAWKENELEKDRLYKEFEEKRNGRVCINHAFYNWDTKEWSLNYSPQECARRCNYSFCHIRQRELDKKKGNVYYDVKQTWITNEGTLLDGTEQVCIVKGKKFFSKIVSVDICEDFIRLESDEIYEREWANCKMRYQNDSLKLEIVNVRVERRETRDLMQDLKDIQEGMQVVHASDLVKQKKEKKREDKEKRIEAHRKRATKQLIENGEMAEKHIKGARHLTAADKAYIRNAWDEQKKYKQISLEELL